MSRATALPPPTGLGWAPPFSVWRDAAGRVRCDLDPRSLVADPALTMWVTRNGDDGRDGLTLATSKASVWRCLPLAGGQPARRIIVEAGVYPHARGFSGVALLTDVVVQGTSDPSDPSLPPGQAVLTASDTGLVWAAAAGLAGVYRVALSYTPYAVFDRQQAGHRMLGVATPADVVNTPGSWAFDTGFLYARLASDRVPDAQVFAMRDAVTFICNLAERRFRLSNISLDGGSRAALIQACTRGVFDRCTMRSSKLEGLGLVSSAAAADIEMYSVRSSCVDTGADGFQYTASGAGSVLKVAEVECFASDLGHDAADSNNATTTHGNAPKVVRIGGYYDDSTGPVVADTGGGKAWIAGSVVGASRALNAINHAGVYTDGETWVEHATVTGSKTSLRANGGAIHAIATTFETSSGAVDVS